jgi:hypothetical protein
MDAEDFLLLYVVYLDSTINRNDNNRQRQHSQYKKKYYNELSVAKRMLRDRRIPRLALHNPQSSAWAHLIAIGNNQALITLTGMDLATFEWLNERFTPLYNQYLPLVSPDGKLV